MPYVDLMALTYGNIDCNGGRWIKGCRSKTDMSFIIPLDEVAFNIIKKYRNPVKMYYRKANGDNVFPYINRTVYAIILKNIGKSLGIAEAASISPNKGRHTFATRMLSRGVSVESIRHMLGHAPNSSCTWLYAEVTQHKLLRELR
jgi:site-specific recombinase XerD